MNSAERELTVSTVVTLLNPRELQAYEYWKASAKPALSPQRNAELFNLWLQGKTCEEIRRLNPALQLGEIIAARIEGEWDRRRDSHLDQLLTATSQRVQQVTLETADFVCDMLAVANKEHGDRLRRYLQSGDAKDLGDFKIDSIFNLKQVIEMLQSLTGQSRQQTVKHQGAVQIIEPIPSVAKPITGQEAGSVLKLLLGK